MAQRIKALATKPDNLGLKQGAKRTDSQKLSSSICIHHGHTLSHTDN